MSNEQVKQMPDNVVKPVPQDKKPKMPTPSEMYKKIVITDIHNSIEADKKRVRTATGAMDLRSIISSVIMSNEPEEVYSYFGMAMRHAAEVVNAIEKDFKDVTYKQFMNMDSLDIGELEDYRVETIIKQLITETFCGVYNEKIINFQKQLKECKQLNK